MKKLFLLLCISMLFIGSGCGPVLIKKDDILSLNLNDEKEAGVGDVFFAFEHKNIVHSPFLGELIAEFESFRFELTIVELGEKVGLYYAEYIYKMPGYDPVTYLPGQGGWIIKAGFNKRFDYATADKIIRFKDYEFEVTENKQGRLKYRRLK